MYVMLLLHPQASKTPLLPPRRRFFAQPAAATLTARRLSTLMGEISTHVISKLGMPSVAGAPVRVFYNTDLAAGFMAEGWTLLKETELSPNGGNDTLVPPGELKTGLYLVEFNFEGVDAAARQIYKKDPAKDEYTALNPHGFFLAARSSVTLKVEDPASNNHLVLSVGDKEVTIRPGVRAH
jgi:hypothetical protein